MKLAPKLECGQRSQISIDLAAFYEYRKAIDSILKEQVYSIDYYGPRGLIMYTHDTTWDKHIRVWG